MEMISLEGARLHNLKSVNVQFPVNRISVVCGPSGCGKSTLVLDVLHGECRRRYLESLNPFALQLLGGRLNIPLDLAKGLRPSLAIEASHGDAPAKSTALSVSECEPLLRVLWAALARPACPHCGQAMQSSTREDILRAVVSLPEGAKIQFLANIPADKKNLGELASVYLAQGFPRALVDGKPVSLGDLNAEEKNRTPETFFIITDRIIVRSSQRTRIAEAIDTTLRLTHSSVHFEYENELHFFSLSPYCSIHGAQNVFLEPTSFSPYSLKGACPVCHGNGVVSEERECPECHGFRLKNSSLYSSFEGVSWKRILETSFRELNENIPKLLEGRVPAHLESTAKSLGDRLSAVCRLGIGYLGAGRGGNTLSSGEFGRLRLSTLASGLLDGMVICLDEPASGLHRNDVQKLWKVLEEIKAAGNTLILIEHHPEVIAGADWVVEMGPGAGEAGGEILYEGAHIKKEKNSPTAQWLSELQNLRKKIPHPLRKTFTHTIPVRGFRHYDMLPVRADFPVNAFSVVSGESGSGKSTLLFEHLVPRFKNGEFRELGIENLSILTAESFQGSRRSTIASAVQIMTPLRELFAKIPESKIRGYSAARFATHLPGGRCETCKGEGILRDPSGYEETECPVCLGRRYRDEILEIRFKSLSIADVLDLSVSRALQIFSAFPHFTERLEPLENTGLGYLRLGQTTAHLSGGERTRLKLSMTLSKAKMPKTLYLFDEPARGLHKKDIDHILSLIRDLCRKGHTVIAIEHQLDFEFAADYLLELKRPETGC
jgi:excinuclease ABC subunit A